MHQHYLMMPTWEQFSCISKIPSVFCVWEFGMGRVSGVCDSKIFGWGNVTMQKMLATPTRLRPIHHWILTIVLSHDNMQPFYAPNNRCMGIHDSNITKNTRKNWHWNLKKWCYVTTRKKINAARQKLHTAYIMIGMYLSRTNTSAVTSTQTCQNFAETVQ